MSRQEFSYPGQPYEYDDPKPGTSNEIHQLRAEDRRLRELIRALLENDPDSMAGDGIVLLDVWRKEAGRVLGLDADRGRCWDSFEGES